jgi:hypothetical protein
MATEANALTLVQLTRAQTESMRLVEGAPVWLQAVPNSTSVTP